MSTFDTTDAANVYERHARNRMREFANREAEMHEELADELNGSDRALMIAIAQAFRKVSENYPGFA